MVVKCKEKTSLEDFTVTHGKTHREKAETDFKACLNEATHIHQEIQKDSETEGDADNPTDWQTGRQASGVIQKTSE